MEQPTQTLKPNASRRWQAWRSYSLRSLLVLVTLVAVWLGVITHKARQQQIAVEAIRAVSGTALFAHQFDPAGEADVDAEPWAPKWLRDVVGEEYFRTLVYVDLVSDRKYYQRHGRWRAEDEVMSAIGLAHTITRLELHANPSITDETLRHLQNLRQLRQMSMWFASVTGPGLRHLIGARNLEHIQLDHTPLTDEGLKYLGQLPNLKFLRLCSTKISDDGLAYLAGLTRLETLVLRNTDVTDLGLLHLRSLQGLRELNLGNTDVTAAGVASLETALPKCDIWPPADDLRRQPRDITFWPPGHKPSREELLRAVKDLKGSVEVNQSTAQPIVALSLRNTDVSPASLLRLLAEMPDVERLEFGSLLAGDDLVAGLASYKSLRSLELSNCQISDNGMKYIAMLPQLNTLSLLFERVSDQGLMQLSEMKSLTKLSVQQTRVTLQGQMRLQQALPNCEIR